jgi:DNA-binding NtrC family response regulator
MPPLRERRDDIDGLCAHFVALLNERFGFNKRLGAAALDLLRQHDWPGNVRELLHIVEAAMIICDGSEIQPQDLPASLRAARPAGPRGSLATLEAVERAQIELALRATNGHRGQAAKLLGISERNLYRKIHEYQVTL